MSKNFQSIQIFAIFGIPNYILNLTAMNRKLKMLVLPAILLLISQASFAQKTKKACTTMEKMAMIKKDAVIRHIDSSGRGLADNYYLWEPGQVLKVKFLSGSPALQAKVRSAANEWMNYANIKFQYVTKGPADIRVLLGEGEGHNSYVGTVCKMIDQSEQTMNLDTSDFFDYYTHKLNDLSLRGTSQHEFGHALGLLHEHSSPISGIQWNKDSIYKVYWTRYGWDKETVDFQVFRTYLNSYTNGTAYDSKSIMHYSIEPWETLNHYYVDWNYYISPGDKQLIGALYPKKGPRMNEVPRISISNFKKITVTENKAKGGLSIYPTFDMAASGKPGKVYLLAEFFDQNYDPLMDTDGQYSFEDRVVTFRSLTTIPGKKNSYNKTKKDMEIFIPYDQLENADRSKDIYVRFRVIQETLDGEIKDVFYGNAASFSFSK
jgi:hypothetical protein